MADPLSDETAGEFVLGTLPPDERRDYLRVLARDPAAVDAVRLWQERLAPLALAVDPVAPPAALQERVMAAIGIAPVSAPNAANDNRSGRWQVATAAASLVALVAAGLALRPREPLLPTPVAPPAAVRPVSLQPTAVAALSAEGHAPGLFVTYDRDSGRLRIVPVGLTADQAHSYELWLIEGKNAPKPMGLVDAGKAAERRIGATMAAGSTLAVSREPVGGSPTGAPTGPVLWSGALVAL